MSDLRTAAEALLYVLDNDSSQGQLDAAKAELAAAAAAQDEAPAEETPTVVAEPTTDALAADAPAPVDEATV